MEFISESVGQLETFRFTYLAVVVLIVITIIEKFRPRIPGIKSIDESKKEKRLIGAKYINGPKTIPILGNALDLYSAGEEMVDFYENKVAKYPKRARFTAFGHDYVFLYNAHDLQKILCNKKNVEKSLEYKIFEWIGDGALTATGSRWLKTRPLLEKAFNFKSLQHFQSTFQRKSLQLVDELTKSGDKVKWEPFDVFPLVVHCGLDIICATMMNTHTNVLGSPDRDEAHGYSHYLDWAADEMHYRMWARIIFDNPLGRFLWKLSPKGRQEQKCFDWMNDFSEKLIEERKQVRAKDENANADEPPCLLDLCLDAHEHDPEFFSIRDVRDEVNTFLTGGHGATTASTGMLLQLIASHPEVQEKMYQELKDIFGDNPKKALNQEDYSKLNYMECVIKESLRLYPGVPIFFRELQTDIELENGVTLPKGQNVFILPYLLHRDPIVFPNPEQFNPDRFGKDAEKRHPYDYLAFSRGPRNCIGKNFAMMEVKTFLSYILIHFKLEKVVETKDVGVSLRIFLKPKNGIVLKLTPRQFN